ncbi:MAG TPA: DinB family protein [Longimicrobium sp.]|nr:DinB family protein [Longimicrobium sp.]
MSDPTPALLLSELVEYEREELARWAEFFAACPGALDLPFAPGPESRMPTVRAVVHHIAGVELRYVDRLEGEPVTPFEAIPREPAEALCDAARDANRRLGDWLTRATGEELARIIEFETISAGTFRASARKIAAHALLHGVRTWAQVATVLRLNGITSPGRHDLLFSEALE